MNGATSGLDSSWKEKIVKKSVPSNGEKEKM
jgi:hypothetical protein